MGDDANEEPLLTSAQVAELLRVHPKHIYRLLKESLPGRRVGGQWRFRRGEVLAWSAKRGVAEVSVVGVGAPLLAANGDVAVAHVLSELARDGRTLWGFVQADRAQALRLLGKGAVTVAGSHGGLPPGRVEGERLARVHLVDREVGLAARTAKKVVSIEQLHAVRVASRPPTAGVHAHLIAAIERAKVSVKKALAHAKEHRSHRDAIDAVLRDEADVALTTHALAARSGLAFRAIATESYGLLVRSSALGSAAVVQLCEVLQSPSLRKLLDGERGYETKDTGAIRYDPDGA